MAALRERVMTAPELRTRADAEAYVASVCFKHGPPRLTGVELEWTLHDAADPTAQLDAARVAAALGPHAPPALVPDSPHLPLSHGSPVTVEPGGQVELSPPPRASLAELITAVSADTAELSGLLAAAGLRLGTRGLDPHRPPRRLLDTPRYAAMESAFAARGVDGITMMCSTAGLQVCLDAGEQRDTSARWAALHALGPVMIATFPNSARHAGRVTGWRSARTRFQLGTDPVRTRPGPTVADPAEAWARRVLDTPLLCLRRANGCWEPPRGITFADWIAGALPELPTHDDLEYHLSTMFPPVRPRGYLEVRYLDSQRGTGWITPTVLLTALLADRSTVDSAREAAAPGAGRWLHAARYGLADPRLAKAAAAVVALGTERLGGLGLPAELAATTAEELERRVSDSGEMA